MEEAVEALCQAYVANKDVNICIAELKKKGFSQLTIINAIVLVLNYNEADAEHIVRENPIWQD